MLSVSNDYASFCKHGLSMVTSVVSEFGGGRERKHACPPSWGLAKSGSDSQWQATKCLSVKVMGFCVMLGVA